MTATRAKWVEGVPNLYPSQLNKAGDYLAVAQVGAKTGLSVNTILDLLSRAPIDQPANALAPISRPAARIGNQPLYSAKQVEEVLERQRTTKHRHLGGGDHPLPTLSPEQANEQGLISVGEIAELISAHEQTIRRWARDHRDFPRAVALRAREGGHPGVPIVMRKGGEVRAWLIEHGHLEPQAAAAS